MRIATKTVVEQMDAATRIKESTKVLELTVDPKAVREALKANRTRETVRVRSKLP